MIWETTSKGRLYFSDIFWDFSSNESLYEADILITDYSSCFVDHLLLDRPQILFAYDLDHYMAHERNLYGDFRADATGRLCEDNAALLDELEKLAQGRDAYAGQRQRIRDFYYNPENQCSVAAKQVEKILSLK